MDARRLVNEENPFNSTSRAVTAAMIKHGAARGDPLDTTWLVESDGHRVPSVEPDLWPLMKDEPVHVTPRLARDVYTNAMVNEISFDDIANHPGVQAIYQSYVYGSFGYDSSGPEKTAAELTSIRETMHELNEAFRIPDRVMSPLQSRKMTSCMNFRSKGEMKATVDCHDWRDIARIPRCFAPAREVNVDKCSMPSFRHFGIENLPSARSIKFNSVRMKNMPDFPSLPNLRSLRIAEAATNRWVGQQVNWFSEIRGLDNLKNLTELEIYGSGASDIKGIDVLPRLKKLTVSSRPGLLSINTIGKHPFLEELDLDNNRLRVVRGIEHLSSLKKVSLAHNDLGRDIYNEWLNTRWSLAHLENLTELDIGWNRITEEFFNVSGFGKLKKLWAPQNFIRNVNAFARLPELEYLDLRGNSGNILDQDGVEKLAGMEKLKHVRFKEYRLTDLQRMLCRDLKRMRPDMVVGC